MRRSTLGLPFIVLAVVFAGCSGSARTAEPAGAADPNVVAIIDGAPLTLQEFEERYARSAGGSASAAQDSLAEYEDFLERYVNFRIKVKAGVAAGLSTASDLRQEIETYRTNLARPYIIDREVLDPLVRQMYDRQQEMVDASHILIRIAPDAPPGDTRSAYDRLAAIADSIRMGADFGEMAMRHSDDPSAQREGLGYRGHLGFFSAGRMVGEFEDAAYGAEVGDVVGPFRTQFGYHLLKVEDRRPAIADVEVSHIMIVPAGPTAEDSSAARQLIQEIADQLEQGADFAALAGEHSVDRQSATRGGEIGAISYANQRIPPSFREAAFSLAEVGDVSDVVETPFGFHLIRLNARREAQSYDEAYETLKNLASRLPKAREGEERFARMLWNQYGGSIDTARVLDHFSAISLDSLVSLGRSNEELEPLAGLVFAELADSSYTLADFAAYAGGRGRLTASDTRAGLLSLIKSFATDKAIDYEMAALEFKDEEFGQIMSEFREGLVLFKLMEDSVWTRAATDTLGLQAHFEVHRDEYQFPERTRIIAYYGRTDSTLRVLAEHLSSGDARSVQAILDDSVTVARTDTVRIAEAGNSIYDQILGQESGAVVGPVQQNREWVVLVHDGVEAPRPKTFDEARATVVSEYQDILEADLVERLRNQFQVRVYPDRLTAAFDDVAADPSQQPSAVADTAGD